MVSKKFIQTDSNIEELKELVKNTSLSMKEIAISLKISTPRLYQLMEKYNIPSRSIKRQRPLKLIYGSNPSIYRLSNLLSMSKSYFKKYRTLNFIQNATVEDLLIEGHIPEFCPILGSKLYIGENVLAHLNIFLKDSTKGYTKGNLVLISSEASKILKFSNTNLLKVIKYREHNINSLNK